MKTPNRPPKGYSVLGMRAGQLLFHKIDNPFIYSVIGTPRLEGGYSLEWWVTGPKGPDSRLDPVSDRPALILVMNLAIQSSRDEFEEKVQHTWAESIEELAFASAMSGGILDSFMWKRLPEKTQHDIIVHHLLGHDYLDHFSKSNKTVRAAMMYLLLHDMGVTKIQQELARFEQYSLMGFELRVSETTVTPTTINQRLTHAKKLGLLPSGSPRSGRKPLAATHTKDFVSQHQSQEFFGELIKNERVSPYLESFASIKNLDERKGAEH